VEKKSKNRARNEVQAKLMLSNTSVAEKDSVNTKRRLGVEEYSSWVYLAGQEGEKEEVDG